MARISAYSLGLAFVVVGSIFSVGCAADDTSGSSSDKVTLTGNVGGGSGTTTKTFGNVSTTASGLHVSAHELYVKGTDGRTVDVSVANDGTFRLDIARGSRWVVTVDDANGQSAILKFGDGESAISASSGDGAAVVDIGSIHVVGGEARTDFLIDGKFGLESTLARADELFKAADGAILAAQEAVAQAEKAYEDAMKAAENAAAAADEAAKAAEDAAAKAQAAAEAAGGK